MNNIYVYDCSNGKLYQGNSNPLSIGNGPEVNILLQSMDNGVAGVILQKDGQYTYYPKATYTINGKKGNTSFALTPEQGVLISSNNGLFQVYISHNPQAVRQNVFSAYNHNAWYYYNVQQGSWQGPLTIQQLYTMANQIPMETWVTLAGMVNGICTLAEFVTMASRIYQPAPQPVAPAPLPEYIPQQPLQTQKPPSTSHIQQPQQTTYPQETKQQPQHQDIPELDEPIDEYEGEHLCPVCWLRFDAGDVMSIASHPDLMGDPILGKHEMRRFFATQFNARGQALDERGMPCMNLACPHCRHKLPPRFLEMDSLIFSIIGAPSSGKSYYLASLIHEMLYKTAPEFGLVWRDADPAGNSMLNDVSNRLFSAATPQQAYLSKTDLEGSLYEDLYRHGRMVKLPKPFVFNISKLRSATPPRSLVFYDNAGEHFEPGRASEDSPGAMHVAVASGIFFLFDPTTCQAFRKIISNTEDPQMNPKGFQMDQQSIIMAETESRIASILNITPGEQIDTPFAILLGKCDLWENYLSTPEGGGAPLLPATAQGKIIKKNIDANSDRLRNLMMKLQPGICMTAESISNNVRYFAISQLGISPETFDDPDTGVTRIGPDPTRLNPRHMCDPTLWMLHEIAPDLVSAV